jgi:NitT/TauT family transport system substrate-binding protein
LERAMFSKFRLVAMAIGLALSATTASAAELTKIKFSLDWKLQGIHTWFFWAQEKGYFAKENLDVTIDQGEGSAGAVTRVMSGAYDAAFGDANAVIQNAAAKPADAPLIVYMMYSRAPFALLTKATSSIHSIKDLEGKKVGAPAAGATVKMLPLMAKKNGIDYSKIDLLSVAPNLQEQLLLQGQVEAIAIFTATSYMNLVALGLDPDKDFRWIYYADAGADLYSNCIIVSQKLAKEKPEAVKGLVRAINRSIKDVIENPDAAIEMLAKKEPLLKKDIEKRRLLYVYKTLMDTPEARKIGMGDVSDQRMSESISMIKEAFDLPRAPKVEDVFGRSFLPPKADRMMPVATN